MKNKNKTKIKIKIKIKIKNQNQNQNQEEEDLFLPPAPSDIEDPDEDLPPPPKRILEHFPIFVLLGALLLGPFCGFFSLMILFVLIWVGFLGQLFLRSLKCIALPLVFINTTTQTCEILRMARTRVVSIWVMSMYMIMTLCASGIGILSFILLRASFIEKVNGPKTSANVCIWVPKIW